LFNNLNKEIIKRVNGGDHRKKGTKTRKRQRNQIKMKEKRSAKPVWEWGPFVLTLRFEVTVHFVGPASDRRPPFADTHLLACRKKNFIEFEISFYLSKEGPKINFRKLFLSSY
jgi:hypothetical protein